MGVGHAAVALGAARAVPKVNVGYLVFAAFLADFLLGLFVSFGWEQVHVPPDYAAVHYLTFSFPYSHGLVPLMIWGSVFGLLVALLQGGERRLAFFVAAGLVLSHFVLDGLVHVVGLPVGGPESPKVGLGLWRNLPLELGLETALAALGFALYAATAGTATGWRRWAILAVVVLLGIFTWGQLFANTAPAVSQLRVVWIAMPLLVSAALFFLDRKRTGATPGCDQLLPLDPP